MQATRREFLGGLGRGALTIGLGLGLARELGFALSLEDEDDDGPLRFDGIEALVARMQEAAPDALQEELAARLASGLPLETVIAAAALANARTFGGHDYEGYHAAMALAPAYDLGQRFEGRARALPVLKVVYRNTARIQKAGGRDGEALRAVAPLADGDAESLRAAALAGDVARAEGQLVGLCGEGADAAYGALQPLVCEDIEVHRIVLAWRAWETLRFTGEAHAATLLRQVVRFCVDQERGRARRGGAAPSLRRVLPALIEEHGLAEAGALGARRASDADLESWASVFFAASREDAAAQAAEALGAGYAADDVGAALSLAANALLLHDPGRGQDANFGRYAGSVHGASVGVHACDSARAYRNIARVVDAQSAAANLIVGAYHTAGQAGGVRNDPFPYAALRGEYEGRDAAALLRELPPALAARDQARACALVELYGERGGAPQDVLELLADVAVRADGALHAEKYFATATEDCAAARPAHRWRHLVALARVSASEAGQPAPGQDAARALLEV